MALLMPNGSEEPVDRKPMRSRPRWTKPRGFTFVELMVVITIIVVLVTMAIPIYQKSILRAKESVLKNNLFTIRTVIDNYTYDKQKAPQSLQDLVSRRLPARSAGRPHDRIKSNLEDYPGRRHPKRQPIGTGHLRHS